MSPLHWLFHGSLIINVQGGPEEFIWNWRYPGESGLNSGSLTPNIPTPIETRAVDKHSLFTKEILLQLCLNFTAVLNGWQDFEN